MSYPVGKTPDGWTRGERLHRYGNGPRYALMQRANLEPLGAQAVADTVVAVEFDTLADRDAWLAWWHER